MADEERWQEVGALRWAQGTDGELVEPFGWAFRWDRALRQAQRPMGSGIGWGEAGTGGGIV